MDLASLVKRNLALQPNLLVQRRKMYGEIENICEDLIFVLFNVLASTFMRIQVIDKCSMDIRFSFVLVSMLT